MQQWVADAQTQGLHVNYTPTGSPDGPRPRTARRLIDFAGTEAEFASLQVGNTDPSRGYQYVPDVAGAVAVMYHVQDSAGDAVDLPAPVARDDRQDLHGRHLQLERPRHHGRQQGPGAAQPADHASSTAAASRAPPACSTTSSQHTDPGLFDSLGGQEPDPHQRPHHRARHGTRASRRHTLALNGSDQIAEHIASGQGLWSIGYDEFGYAKTYNVPDRLGAERVSGTYQLPYAQNISAALEAAKLRPDLSQDLSGRVRQRQPARLSDLGLQLHRHPVRRRRPTAPPARATTATRASPRPSPSGCATSPATAR